MDLPSTEPRPVSAVLSQADLEFVCSVGLVRGWDLISGIARALSLQVGTPTICRLLRRLADTLEARQ